jgi:MIP family channel proteins
VSTALKPLAVGEHATPRHSLGLHGHLLDSSLASACLAEFAGTLLLVVAITGTAVPAVLNATIAGSALNSTSVALAGGFALTIIVAAIGRFSGAHVNPAVTAALAMRGRFPWRRVPAYLAAQVGGALCGALLVWAMDGSRARSIAHLGAPGPAAGVDVWRLIIAELVGTFILVFVVAAAAIDDRVPKTTASAAIGLALLVGIFVSGPISGAGLNPARALGPMIVAGTLHDWWVYVIAPPIGGFLALFIYERGIDHLSASADGQ